MSFGAYALGEASFGGTADAAVSGDLPLDAWFLSGGFGTNAATLSGDLLLDETVMSGALSCGAYLAGTLAMDDFLLSGAFVGVDPTANLIGRRIGPRVGLRANGELIVLF